MDYQYVPATEELLKRIWAKNIAAHPGDDRWVRWGDEALDNNLSGRSKTFMILYQGEPIGEGTLLFDPSCSAINGRTQLADGKTTTNVNALRIEKAHEGKGHISKLVRMMESYAKEHGYTHITIGVDAIEARNLGIYLHWHYDKLVHWEVEDNELVLYYDKPLI